MANQEETNGIIEERANRLRLLRDFLDLSRPKFSAICDIPADTLRNWEQARYGGLTEKGARKIIPIFNKKGIRCTIEWLLYGIGGHPLPRLKDSPKTGCTDEKNITQELILFHQLNPGAVDHCMADDSMSPLVTKGDLVAGRALGEEELEQAIGFPCIINTHAGEILVRQVERGEKNGVYHLACLNNKTRDLPPLIKNIALLSAAPILWIRKKLSV